LTRWLFTAERSRSTARSECLRALTTPHERTPTQKVATSLASKAKSKVTSLITASSASSWRSMRVERALAQRREELLTQARMRFQPGFGGRVGQVRKSARQAGRDRRRS
jgi:hypothetical protein